MPLIVSSHNGTWRQTTWWPSSTFFSFFNYLRLLLKRWMKTRASSRDCDVCALNFTECLIWIGLTMTFSLKITALVEYVFWTPSIMHALYWSMSKYYHVVNEAKTVQRVCGNCDFDKTLCWWFLFESNKEWIFTELISYLKENPPSGPLTLLTCSTAVYL